MKYEYVFQWFDPSERPDGQWLKWITDGGWRIAHTVVQPDRHVLLILEREAR